MSIHVSVRTNLKFYSFQYTYPSLCSYIDEIVTILQTREDGGDGRLF